MKTEKISYHFSRIIMAFPFLLLPIVSSFAQNGELTGYLSNLPFEMPAMTVPVFPDRSVNIADFGAVGDGQTLNTEAFANAIEHCASLGGGTVIVPPGLWLTGPVLFRSNINLHLEKGALVLFSRNHKDYPVTRNPVNGSFTVTPPISGYELENIAITGEGILDGSGDTWRPVKKSKTTEEQWKKLLASGGAVDSNDVWWPTREAMEGEQYIKDLKKKNVKILAEKDFEPARDFLRPYMLFFYKCKKVLLDGPTFQNSPKFVLYPTFCEDLVIRNIRVLNEWWAQNGDGIDINGGKNILVYNCLVNAGDDGICMKSSKSSNYGNDPVLQNVVISGCTVYHAHGGFVIGSNIDGGMRNISVNNCNFISTDVGLRFKSNRGRGGLVENIFINNIFMKDIANEAISFDTYYEVKNPAEQAKVAEVNETTPRFRKFYIRNICCNGAGQAVEITGLPEMPVQDVEFSSMVISAHSGFSSREAANIRLNNVSIIPGTGIAYSLENSRDFLMKKLACPSASDLFMRLEGAATGNIRIENTDLSKCINKFEFGKGTQKSAVIVSE